MANFLPNLEMRAPSTCFPTCQEMDLDGLEVDDDVDAEVSVNFKYILHLFSHVSSWKLNEQLSASTGTLSLSVSSRSSEEASATAPPTTSSQAVIVRSLSTSGTSSTSGSIRCSTRLSRPYLHQPISPAVAHPVHSSIADWRSYIGELVEESCTSQPWRAEGQTSSDLAEVIAAFVFSKFADEPLEPSSLPEGVKIGSFFTSISETAAGLSLSSLFIKNQLYKV